MSYPEPLPQSAMLASSADRDRTVDVLRAAFAEGRLTDDEFSQRVDVALRARTYGELGELVADVPVGPLPWHGLAQPTPTKQVAPRPWPKLPQPPATRTVAHRSETADPAAVTALVLGIAGIVLSPIASVGAIISGHIAQARIIRHGTGGATMSTIGLLLGYLGIAIAALLVLLVVAGAAFSASGGAPPMLP